MLATIYLVFTEGYAPTTGYELLRRAVPRGIRLGRLLRQLMPKRKDVQGLLALMLLHDARRRARATAAGDIIRLEDQDRDLWDAAQIAEGAALVEQALRAPGVPSAYAVQAAIAACMRRLNAGPRRTGARLPDFTMCCYGCSHRR